MSNPKKRAYEVPHTESAGLDYVQNCMDRNERFYIGSADGIDREILNQLLEDCIKRLVNEEI